MNTHETTLSKLGVAVLSSLSTRVAKLGPARRMIAHQLEKRLQTAIHNAPARSCVPGARRDRLYLLSALMHSVSRIVFEPEYSPRVKEKVHAFFIDWLIQRLQKGDPASAFRDRHGVSPPAFLVVSPTGACNLRCSGCYADSTASRASLQWDTFDQVVSDMKRLWGSWFVVISGGEPFLYRSAGKGILEIAEKHSDCFFLVYTNGTLIDRDTARRLAQVGNITPAISVEGMESTTDKRRGQGTFKRILAAMSRLREHGVPFGLSITATRNNCEEVLSERFIEFFFNEMGALYGWIFHYMPIGRSYSLSQMPTPEQRLWMWKRTWHLVIEKKLFLADFWNHGPAASGCIAAGRPGGYFYIDWNGNATPCVFVPYSPVNVIDVYKRGGTLDDVWAHPYFQAIREWQRQYGYGRKSGAEVGNWLAPCFIRDHYEICHRLTTRFSARGTDGNAESALSDRAYFEGLSGFGKRYRELTAPLWERYYRKPAEWEQIAAEELPGFLDMPRALDYP